MTEAVRAAWVGGVLALACVAGCGRSELASDEAAAGLARLDAGQGGGAGAGDAGAVRDGGTDGGVDGGTADAGGNGCARCDGVCLDGRCLPGTRPQRVCQVTAARCLRCEDQAGETCVLLPCPERVCPGRERVVQVNRGSWPMPGGLVGLYREREGEGCLSELLPVDGGAALGTAWLIESAELLAVLPGQGGTCLGVNVPTGLQRWNLFCPAGPLMLTCL